MFHWLTTFFRGLDSLLHKPSRVLILCGLALIFSLVIQGSIFRLWSLNQNNQRIKERISKIKKENKELERKIAEASNLEYLEIRIREQFDLVEEGDIVFVFSDQVSGVAKE